MSRSIYEIRFWNKVRKTKTCWLWTGAKSTNGYGSAWFNKKLYPAHRVAYELLKGKIQKGLHLDHLCRNPSCVNADHLEAVTPRVNCLRGIGPSAIHARKTNCIRGHELTGENLDINTKGARLCLQCRKEIAEKTSTLIGPTRDKTHCINGHEYTSENTRINSKGYRMCRACHKKTANAGPHKDRARCKNGHKYTTETIYMNTRGIKECQICRRLRAGKRYAKILNIKHLI